MLAPRFADPKVISFAAGYPSAESFPAGELAEIARDVLLNDTVTALQYAPSSGLPCFINAALEHYVKPYKRLDNLSPDKVLVATGSTQAFEVIINTLFNPGDVVLVENPTFGDTTSQLDVARVDMVGVDADDDGVIIEDLEAK